MERTERLVEVELVEDDALDEPPVRETRRLGPLVAHLLVSVPRRAWILLAGLVVLGLVSWLLAERAAVAARDARLARTERLSVSLAQPLRPVWRTPGTGVVGTVPGAVLVGLPADTGTAALDVDTGQQRYTVPGMCMLASEEPAPGRLAAATEGGDDLLMCVTGQTQPGWTFDAGGAVGQGTTVNVHDPVEGDLLRSLDMQGRGFPWVLGLDAVSVGRDPVGHVLVDLWSLRSGERMWSYRSAEPVPVDDVTGWGMTRDEGTLHLTAGAWSASLDVDTGRDTGSPLPGGAGRWGPVGWDVELPDGGHAAVRMDPEGIRESTVTDADGRELFTAAGEVLVPLVDDGTAEGSLLLATTTSTDDRLEALDGTTGRTEWSVTAPPGELAVLSGSVLVRHGAGLVALDASTGAVRWENTHDTSTDSGWGMVTDGLRVLTVEPAGQGRSLVARDVDTGEQVWRRPLPTARDGAFTTLTQLPDGTVVLHDGQEQLVVLRP